MVCHENKAARRNKYITVTVKHGGGGVVIFAPRSRRADHELLRIPQFSPVRCEAVRPKDKENKPSFLHNTTSNRCGTTG